jgi:hypothetical protein
MAYLLSRGDSKNAMFKRGEKIKKGAKAAADDDDN